MKQASPFIGLVPGFGSYCFGSFRPCAVVISIDFGKRTWDDERQEREKGKTRHRTEIAKRGEVQKEREVTLAL